jgi:multiple sugar transport system substrate-binding protein
VAPLRPTRRATITGALASLSLAACGGGGGDSGNSSGGLRFTWWGGDLRNTMTQQVIEAFNAANPDSPVSGEPGAFEGYFDKLATQVAAGDAPDIIQMPESYFLEYVGRGALLDLTDLDIPHDSIDDAIWNAGIIDGKLYGVPSGVNTHCIIADPTLFAEAGIALPDDTTWTWDDYRALAKQLSDALGDGRFGSGPLGLDQNGLGLWLRQHDAQLFTTEGGLGFEAADAAPYWELALAMSEEGAIPGGDETTEQAGATLEQSGTATGRYAMAWWASNQLANLNSASGKELAILRPPTVAGSTSEGEYSAGPGWYVVYSKSENAEAAGTFLDFLVNSQTAGDILLTERGTPPNTTVSQTLVDTGKLSEADVTVVEFLTELTPDLADPTPALTPVGGSDFQNVMRRYTGDVLFGRTTPVAAAQDLIDEVSGDLEA